jgi:hypothetical protein
MCFFVFEVVLYCDVDVDVIDLAVRGRARRVKKRKRSH